MTWKIPAYSHLAKMAKNHIMYWPKPYKWKWFDETIRKLSMDVLPWSHSSSWPKFYLYWPSSKSRSLNSEQIFLRFVLKIVFMIPQIIKGSSTTSPEILRSPISANPWILRSSPFFYESLNSNFLRFSKFQVMYLWMLKF